jgi:hypothetical protein
MSNKCVRLSLRLWGENLRPPAVTNALGLEPSEAYEKGFTKKLSSGTTTAPRPLGMWALHHVVTSSLEAEILSFIEKIGVNSLKHIEGVDVVILDINLGLSDNESRIEEHYECMLNSDVINKIHVLGLDVRITVY